MQIDQEGIHHALRLVLLERNEPVPYLFLHAAALSAMAANHSLRWREEALTQIHIPIQAALEGQEFIHHSESPNPESGLWALAEWDRQADPLPDRVEIALVHFLQKNPISNFRDIETNLNCEFPGLLTPSLGLLRAILVSYALETDGQWTLRPEDAPAARRADLETAAQALDTLGVRLGYSLQRTEKTGGLSNGWRTGRSFTTSHCWFQQ
jgi:hypothetical protein